MTYETFQKEVLNGLQGRLAGNVSLSLTQNLKRNGQIRQGIIFKNPVTNAFPTIYLEEYYEHYQKTGNLVEIIEVITSLYHSLPVMKVDKQEFLDFSHAKCRIIMKLINTGRNRTFLETVPHTPFNDLSIVYYYFLGTAGGRTLDMPINHELLKKWGVDTITLHQHAMENYNNLLPIKFASLNQQLADIDASYDGYSNIREFVTEDPENDFDNALYFLSNEQGLWGAALITCKNLMDAIGDFFKENYYIIPCSIHEVLLLPESKAPSKAVLDQMIQKVNREAVEPEDYLSDHAYYFSRTGENQLPHFLQNLMLQSIGSII